MTAATVDRDRNRTGAPPTAVHREGQGVDELRVIPLGELIESPWNPRKRFDAEQLEDLADSLRKGQLAPIIVRPVPPKLPGSAIAKYEIGAGHRRYRAAPLAGLTSLLAIVRDLDDVAFLELLTIENKQREDIAPLDEAAGFKLLMEKAGYDVAKLAARIGLSTKYVYDRIKLLQLIPAAKKMLEDGVITAGHAILLARLTPTDQARAIGNVKDVEGGVLDGDSLLLERDHAADDELPLHDRVKPVSVREFQKAIQRNIRARPEAVDPFLFPESAAALEAAKEEKLSVIHITRDYLASDEVRSAEQKERVFGSEAWKRADGQVDPYEDYRGAKSKTRSKPCDWSRYGFVASGPGQGEVFKVCINKQKCKVHWPEHVKRAEQAKKRAKSGRVSTGSAEKDANTVEAERKRAEADEERANLLTEEIGRLIKERALGWAQEICALANQIKLPKQIAQYLAREQRLLVGGLEDICEGYDDDATTRGPEIWAAIKGRLPGKWSTGYAGTPVPKDEKAAVLGLALLYWLANSTKKLDAELEAAAEKIVAAAEAQTKKSEAKKPATKKAKKSGKR